MTASIFLRHRLTQSGAMGIDRAPAWLWIALQTAALWPAWRWMAACVADGSGDPLGLIALAALGALLWLVRQQLRCAPRLPWLAAALAGTLAATLLRGLAAPLATSLLAIAAWACCLLAFLPAERRGAMQVRDGVLWPAPSHAIAAAPVLGLAALALPLIAPLQLYADYPLRALTAKASGWLLSAGFAVQREGASLLINGQPVVGDASCFGVRMIWAGCFTACAVALLKGRTSRAFFMRLPLAGLMALAGSVLCNAALAALQADGHHAAPWLHQGLGLLILAVVCVAIAGLMSRGEKSFALRRRIQSAVFPSFPRRRESIGALDKRASSKKRSWIPACAGMTKHDIGDKK